ncbi:MAG: AMP-binding protein [Myxococcales bacterium]|nr:AMP-binding protein [Myxococcales bacterium]
MLNFARLDSLGEILHDALFTFKSNVALIEANRHRETARYTFAELRHVAEGFAGRLQAAGFEPGERLAIVMQNQSKWVISGLGGLFAGAVLVPIDYKLTAAEQLTLLAHCKPAALVVEYPTWRQMLQHETAAALENTLVLVSEAPDGADLGPARRWEDPVRSGFSLSQRRRTDVACIVYTSGTSGRPKGCMLTHDNYIRQAESLSQIFWYREEDNFFSILPTNHAIDFMCGFIVPLMLGSTIVHQRTLRPQYLVSTMKRYQISVMALVPMLLKAFEKKLREGIDELPAWKRTLVDSLVSVNRFATRREPNPELSRLLLGPIHDKLGGHLRLLFVGGAFVERNTAEFFYQLGIPVAIGYGLTEAGTVLTVNDLKPFRGDTVGAAVPGTKVEIRNANDQGIGEVWVKGPTVMQGYLDEPELTGDVLIDGWLRTGDLGELDAAGHLKLVGRQKNMIVTEGGKNVYPEDIESAFDDVSGCEEVCVFAANYVWPRQTMLGEELLLVVRPKSDGDLEQALLELRARNRRLVDFKRVKSYLTWSEAFPRTASMKVKRQVLAEQLREALERETGLLPL